MPTSVDMIEQNATDGSGLVTTYNLVRHAADDDTCAEPGDEGQGMTIGWSNCVPSSSTEGKFQTTVDVALDSRDITMVYGDQGAGEYLAAPFFSSCSFTSNDGRAFALDPDAVSTSVWQCVEATQTLKLCSCNGDGTVGPCIGEYSLPYSVYARCERGGSSQWAHDCAGGQDGCTEPPATEAAEVDVSGASTLSTQLFLGVTAAVVLAHL